MAEEKDNKPVKFKAVPPSDQNIGIEVKKDLAKKLAQDEGMASQLDSSVLAPFREISTRRETQYKMYDEMAKDIIVSSALDLYADDATEYGEDGRVIWATSDDEQIAKTVNYLLKSLKLDENAWLHIHALVQYGDLYLQTFRASDIDEENGEKQLEKNYNRKPLKESKENKDAFLLEDVIVNVYGEDDKLEEYIEMVPNPAELFDLVKRGKTQGFLKTTLPPDGASQQQNLLAYNYHLKSNDVKIYDATKFIHIYLPDSSNRSPETVQLFREPSGKSKVTEKDLQSLSYVVKRGKSILYDIFKIYREMKLLEDSILLSRLTKSSILRVVQVEVGDMGKASVQQVLQRVKTLMEQKTSMTEGTDINSYLNPGAIENNIYVPVRDNKGTITTNTIGGDFEPGQLTDLDYFNNKLFGGLKIPKPFLGFMDDNAGFSGGESLTKASSRYAKTIKRIKNAYIQGITTLINIFLIDRGLESAVNAFEIKMVSPTTTEDTERMEILQTKTQLISEILGILGDIDDSADRLKVAKLLINKYMEDAELTGLLEEIIAKQEAAMEDANKPAGGEDDFGGDDLSGIGGPSDIDNISLGSDAEEEITPPEEEDDDEQLPNPSELDMDLSDNEEVSDQLGGEE